jgi:hypothetical protein
MKRCLIVIVLLLASKVATFAQCAMCRGQIESTFSNGRYVNGSGLNTGIIYLLIIPYLAIAVVSYFWYQSSKKELAKRQAIKNRVRQALS